MSTPKTKKRRLTSIGDCSITSKVTSQQFKDAATAALKRRGIPSGFRRSWGYGIAKNNTP